MKRRWDELFLELAERVSTLDYRKFKKEAETMRDSSRAAGRVDWSKLDHFFLTGTVQSLFCSSLMCSAVSCSIPVSSAKLAASWGGIESVAIYQNLLHSDNQSIQSHLTNVNGQYRRTHVLNTFRLLIHSVLHLIQFASNSSISVVDIKGAPDRRGPRCFMSFSIFHG